MREMRRLLFWGAVLISLPSPTAAPSLCCRWGSAYTSVIFACFTLFIAFQRAQLLKMELKSSQNGTCHLIERFLGLAEQEPRYHRTCLAS